MSCASKVPFASRQRKITSSPFFNPLCRAIPVPIMAGITSLSGWLSSKVAGSASSCCPGLIPFISTDILRPEGKIVPIAINMGSNSPFLSADCNSEGIKAAALSRVNGS